MNNIYTIGHSTRDISEFIEMMQKYDIKVLIDVRSVPYSHYAPSYNKNSLQKSLYLKKIEYIYMGEFLGGRPQNSYYYTSDGYWNYEAFADSKEFKEGISRIMNLSEKVKVVLMCSELQPWDCHRSLIIGRYLLNNCKIDIKHIVEIDELLSQYNLEKILVNKHFPEENAQYSFFELEDTIERAYEQQIKEIFKKMKRAIER